MNHMDGRNLDAVTPRAPEGLTARPWLDFEAGYIKRVVDKIPKQGDRDPWQNKQDYKFDKAVLLTSALENEALEFTSSKADKAA